MKKSLTFICLLCFIFIFSQKNKNYLAIGYSSICCGTPSKKPVSDYLKQFQKQNKLKDFEIWVENGLGKEGEFCLYIGIDALDLRKKDAFLKGLKKVTESQNNLRKKNSDGYVNMVETLVAKSDLLKIQKHPTTRISKLSLYKLQ